MLPPADEGVPLGNWYVDTVVLGEDEETGAEGFDFVGVDFISVGREIIKEFICERLVHVAAGSAGVGKEIGHHSDGFLT